MALRLLFSVFCIGLEWQPLILFYVPYILKTMHFALHCDITKGKGWWFCRRIVCVSMLSSRCCAEKGIRILWSFHLLGVEICIIIWAMSYEITIFFFFFFFFFVICEQQRYRLIWLLGCFWYSLYVHIDMSAMNLTWHITPMSIDE